MKYIILVPDGVADRPLVELDGQTPLAAARTPNLDKLAAVSTVGLAATIPTGMPPGSAVGNLSLMGYNPAIYFAGRGPLEAASMGIAVNEGQTAWRCNLLTITDNVMTDFTASHITTGEAAELIASLKEELDSDQAAFYPGISYRHLCVLSGLEGELQTTPPHDIVGQAVDGYWPQGKSAPILTALMERASSILATHPLNVRRIEQGRNPANAIWLWGGGSAAKMPTMKERYNLSAAVISAVDLIKGMGILAGMEQIEVPGATGFLDTDYGAKARYGLKALDEHDILYLHLEAPDEAGHMGDVKAKITAIENFDELIVGRIISEADKWPDYKLLCLPDHATPISLKTHSSEPVPYLIFQKTRPQNGCSQFSEASVGAVTDKVVPAWDLLDIMIKGEAG